MYEMHFTKKCSLLIQYFTSIVVYLPPVILGRFVVVLDKTALLILMVDPSTKGKLARLIQNAKSIIAVSSANSPFLTSTVEFH